MQNKPNFIIIFPDQWRGDCLGSVGHPIVETPFLDKIASEGINFTAAYSAAPTCIPARACLATGQTPSSVGRLGYEELVPWTYEKTMMKCLRDEGYQTMQAGKTHFYPQRAALGFEEMRLYEIPIHDKNFESDYHVWLLKESNGKVQDIARQADPNTWVVKTWDDPEYMHPTNWIVDSAIELLWRRDNTRPFFLQIGIHRPHAPYDPPRSYYEMYKNKDLVDVPYGDWSHQYDIPTNDVSCWSGRIPNEYIDKMRKAYFASMTHIDYQIGKLYNWLRKEKLLENTYLIFISDHGEQLGDHCLFRKATPFEGSAKIPLIVRPPVGNEFRRNVKLDHPVTHMDIMPTLLDAAQINIPKEVEGESLLPLFKCNYYPWRDFIHGEHANDDHGWQYLTDGKEKYIWETASGKELFFDLVKDPREIKNCINQPEYMEKVEIWRQRLIKILSYRTQDGLSDGNTLISGKVLPKVRR
jgi:arylsulfatase